MGGIWYITHAHLHSIIPQNVLHLRLVGASSQPDLIQNDFRSTSILLVSIIQRKNTLVDFLEVQLFSHSGEKITLFTGSHRKMLTTDLHRSRSQNIESLTKFLAGAPLSLEELSMNGSNCRNKSMRTPAGGLPCELVD